MIYLIKHQGALLLVMAALVAFPQEKEVDYAAQLAKLESELDSLGIFSLIDSVLQIKIPSEFNVRILSSSNVLSAGRNYGVSQHGLSPGVSFYHRKGLFADLSGYWNSAYEPNYNLTMATVGYIGSISDRWNYSVTAERWFYNQDKQESISPSLHSSIGGTMSYDIKWLATSADYSFLFGTEAAHRLIGSTTGRIRLKGWGPIDHVTLYPGASILFGTQDIVIRFEGDFANEMRSNEYLRQNLRSEEFLYFARGQLSEEEQHLISQVQSNNRLSPQQKKRAIRLIYFSNPGVQTYIFNILDTEEKVFGLMNYNFSLPVSFTAGDFYTVLSYTYSVPVQLPGESLEFDPVGYFGVSLVYRMPLR